MYLVRDSVATFISIMFSSSEIIPCSYQYTVSGMITLKSSYANVVNGEVY